MKVSDVKNALSKIETLRFRLPDGSYVPAHFHLTEVGLVTRHFIDCGGVVRKEAVANFQLWQADDYDHRLAPQKFLKILDLSKKVLGDTDLDVEVEYQQGTIGKFALDFDGQDFTLLAKKTACLAQDSCGIPSEQERKKAPASCCAPSGDCC